MGLENIVPGEISHKKTNITRFNSFFIQTIKRQTKYNYKLRMYKEEWCGDEH